MGLYLITGVAGSGKSTVTLELKKRGFMTYDTDEIGDLSQMFNIVTDKPLTEFIPSEKRDEKWIQEHRYKINRSKFRKLAQNARTKEIYVAGLTSDLPEYYSQFDKIFCLTANKKTISDRITRRTNNTYGKNAIEMKNILEHHDHMLNHASENKMILIDSQQPVKKIVGAILDIVNKS